MKEDIQKIENLCINTIRFLSADAVQKAQSGHPGTAMGAAPIGYLLWKEFLRHSPLQPDWVNRDRFVLSSGHASMLLYSLLHLSGYPLTIEDLKEFRQWGSKTPGHPEYRHVPGVEATTGPLGQGVANAVGMAIAEAHLVAKFNHPGMPKLVDHYTYVLASDGDLMEGVSAEAASLAGHLGLGKLILLYDDNQVTIDGATQLAFSEDVLKRFDAYGWHTQSVEDVLSLDHIRTAIENAKDMTEQPSIIAIKSVIGYSAPTKQGKSSAHAGPLGEEELRKAKESQGWPTDKPFYVPSEVYEHFKSVVKDGERYLAEWGTVLDDYTRQYPDEVTEFNNGQNQIFNPDWVKEMPRFEASQGPLPTRMTNVPVLESLAPRIPHLMGGAADLTPATMTTIQDSNAIARGDFSGRNIHFGVREHAMGSITNGMMLHGGIRAYTATFLVFADYMRPAMRMSALMKLPTIYVFTHDSIGLGEDGPTHQPIEQIMSLRLIPNMTVIRPCDANEVVEAWQVALKNLDGPTCIMLTRQPLPVLERAKEDRENRVEKGAYILSEAQGRQAKDGPDRHRI